MKPRSQTSQSGVALIIVMISVVVLTLLAGALARSMRVETRLAINANNSVELEWMGRSGVEWAKMILGEQLKIGQEPYDSLNQIWAGGPGGVGMSNSPLADMPNQIELGNGVVYKPEIIDLDRKANINKAGEPMLQQALILAGVDAGDIPTIVNSILDWIDPDDMEHTDGAESDYYQSFDPPYYAKDGPIDDLSELLFVQGITRELYLGGGAGGLPPIRMPQQNSRSRLGFQEPPATAAAGVGLAELFTAVSSGRININTAPASVLQLLPFVDERAAGEIIRMRAGPDAADGTEDDIPYRNPGELINAGLPNQVVQQLTGLCDVRSRIFEVRVTAEIQGYKRKFIAIVARNSPKDIQTLTFRSEDDFGAGAVSPTDPAF
jgi:general secretion pathway protein K